MDGRLLDAYNHAHARMRVTTEWMTSPSLHTWTVYAVTSHEVCSGKSQATVRPVVPVYRTQCNGGNQCTRDAHAERAMHDTCMLRYMNDTCMIHACDV